MSACFLLRKQTNLVLILLIILQLFSKLYLGLCLCFHVC